MSPQRFALVVALAITAACGGDDDADKCPQADNSRIDGECYSGSGTAADTFPDEQVTLEFRGNSSIGTVILVLQAGVSSGDELLARDPNDFTPLRSFQVGQTYDRADGCGISFPNTPLSSSGDFEVTITAIQRIDGANGIFSGSISGSFTYEGTRDTYDDTYPVSGSGTFEDVSMSLTTW